MTLIVEVKFRRKGRTIRFEGEGTIVAIRTALFAKRYFEENKGANMLWVTLRSIDIPQWRRFIATLRLLGIKIRMRPPRGGQRAGIIVYRDGMVGDERER